jgi:catechol 2,3-dioxygenase-like lactoylglutathione lyase family enzyme
VQPKTLDHVAFWVADRDPLVAAATERFGMHVIDEQEKFTLIGSHARRGKLTFFTAEPARERGALKHVALRVSQLPSDADGETDLGEGIRLMLVEAPTDVEYDLDHVALYTRDPEATAAEYAQLGFRAAEPRDGNPRVEVGGAYVEFHSGDPGETEKPVLNHLAVLVDSAAEHTAEAERRGIVESVVDAANTRAVFVWGPDRVRIEYVEHKPEFSLQ